MKLKIGLLVSILLMGVIGVRFYNPEIIDNQNVDISSVSSAIKTSAHLHDVATDFTVAFSSAASSTSSSQVLVNASSSAASSSLQSLSGERVTPIPEIEHFLRQLDNAIIPKIHLPAPKRDSNFDYKKATAPELKEKALADDPYAAYLYAEHVVNNGVRTITDTGASAYEINNQKRAAAMTEAREFYVRAFRGGIASAADVLSRLYINVWRGGNRTESLAWRKMSFAVGESERYDCLRNSTTCVVKDFNAINRVELFYPCLSSDGDSCTQLEYDNAMALAMQYADSLEFAIHNKVPQ